MWTVGRLARRFGLSRSTLLYYHRLGLLSPSHRGPNNYRLYSEADARRLARILEFREIGLPLQSIAPLLNAPKGSIARVLEQRLAGINDEIQALRRQQRVLLGLLREPAARGRARGMDKTGWTNLLRATGLDDRDMARWHREFERAAPDAHQDFLESLGIDAEEIAEIRSASGSPRNNRQ